MLKKFWSNTALGLIALTSLVACNHTLPVNTIEETIQSDLTQHGKLSVKFITCPTTVKPEQGKSFECVAELDAGGIFFVTVIQEDDRGKVRWEVPSSWSLLNLAQLEAEFEQKLRSETKATLKVNCNGLYRPTKPGDSFECQLLQAATKKQTGRSATIWVRVEPEGKVTWQEVRIVETIPKQPAPLTSGSALTTQSDQVATSTIDLTPQVGAKDETGWTQLED